MVTPNTVYDYHIADDRLETLKVREIPSGYDASKYTTERLMAPSRDGTLIPVSVVYRRDFVKDGSGPLHMQGYGAYGYAYPPGFSANRLSLLDRGFACAIAHIRGGDDLGYRWYLDGKLEKRTNTFNDFVDVTRFLIAQGFAAPGRVTAAGGSAGGELMGAIVNQAPELYGAIAAHVPFVDVLNTMLDGTLPLTPGEWSEWGNPIEDKAAFDFIRSYSPYDNVTRAGLPADAGDGRAQRSAGHLLGAGKVGGEAARHQDRQQSTAAQDKHGRRPRRQVGPLCLARGSRGGICLPDCPSSLRDFCRGNLAEETIIHKVSVLAWRRHAGSLSSEQAWEDWPPRSACGSGASRSKSMSNRQHSAKLVLASTSRPMERRS